MSFTDVLNFVEPPSDVKAKVRRSAGARRWGLPRIRALGFVGLFSFLCIAGFAVLGPVVTGRDPLAVDVTRKLAAPGRDFLLGADSFGRDVTTRLALAIRLSLAVGCSSVAFAMVVGSAMGAVAGYSAGWWDEVLMRVTDVIMAFPYIVLAIALAAAVGPGLRNVVIIIGVLRVPHFARVARGSVLAVRGLEYVTAARAIGQRPTIVFFKHVLPNTLWSLLVIASVSAATAINAEAAISFLGLGVTPPTPSLGSMLAEAQQYVLAAPWLAVWPGAAVSLIVLSLNLIGDSLQEILDPRLRGR